MFYLALSSLVVLLKYLNIVKIILRMYMCICMEAESGSVLFL